MRRSPAFFPLIFLAAAFPFAVLAQDGSSLEMGALSQIVPGVSAGSGFFQNDTWYGTNGVYVKSGDTVLTADGLSVNSGTGETIADGNVHIEQGDQIWVGEHIRYNFKTHQMQSEQFRTGKPPIFAAGKELQGNTTNRIYTARHVFVTADDVSDPAVKIRASKIKIIPGQSVEMWNAVAFVDGVPVFYFPYYKRNLGDRADNLNLTPGYRSAYGPYLLTTYTWYLGDNMDGRFHLDYREQHGVGVGPDCEPATRPLGRFRDANIIICTTTDRTTARTDCRISVPSRKPPAFLLQLSGDAVHEPERQGAGELPERPVCAARLF
jgi:hypothetical protein